ncbi:hypothetical protein HVA01_23950 [Halovibrio variabilis]|uniref:MAE-28990/MAE-18760-like HEPN domain-containing protein n=1 Tax=Halovibrio variabilis TaxID=31910 RepID=A0A511UQ73_9GAMM|nr:MAE_28990/MAE_18760 family HEPN-like nuclease [Halovibrio variabilis]GEN28749.1 hypothetical protein HVA01_23950 [Halovibrio variabilis]
MELLRNTFKERLDEVNSYMDLLEALDRQSTNGAPRIEGESDAISRQQLKILYSCVYLQLYNLVEATITLCLDMVARAATNNESWLPSDFREELFREWVRSMARTHVDLSPDKRLAQALEVCRYFVSSLPVKTFSIEKGGGGNWDDGAIEKMTIRLGFNLNISRDIHSGVKRPIRDDMGALSLVKSLRNRLAHGSLSFTESAENTTVSELLDLKERAVKYLEEVVECFCGYVERYEFLLDDKRPA